MNLPFSMHTWWFFHNAIQQESKSRLIRIKVATQNGLMGDSLGMSGGCAARSVMACQCRDPWQVGSNPHAAMRSLHHEPSVMRQPD
ncbi:MAG: hypothetical protein Q7U09_19300 [Hydrogenophaga sp.]|uniref:hypothetical protein n=1 Tax=Hydrogenophaga aromaticivorans TaxID=2610898 RepID=UPI001B368357|nr:hypothetical protein [Hydrogenophaga aromaticivorans]MBQ0920132.1 hypothetical protein [Hydrogenophaga aromaticivorans]MDO9293729.1 hypothetical protein [Hydrogenophaga sp.]